MLTRKRPRRKAFSFIELVLCVLVMGILAGVAAPRYRAALDSTSLKCAANRLVADIRHAQSMAMRRSESQGLEFRADAGEYRSARTDDAALTDAARPGVDLAVRFDPVETPVSIESADFGGQPLIKFDFRGDPSSGGKVVLTAGDRTAVVTVTEAGAVSASL